jgi:hypothetical protein
MREPLWIELRLRIEGMVEAAGVEPASENTQREESTCVSGSLGFRDAA